jgi:hypothetical protein
VSNKPRVRLYHLGQATFRLVTRDRGWGGAYGQELRPAKWACIACGRKIDGTDDQPWRAPDEIACSRNGHAPCRECGKQLPRLNDGCPREHNWRICPGKTEAHRMTPQHAHKDHLTREVTP